MFELAREQQDELEERDDDEADEFDDGPDLTVPRTATGVDEDDDLDLDRYEDEEEEVEEIVSNSIWPAPFRGPTANRDRKSTKMT